MDNFNLKDYQAKICSNVKRIRKDLYNENKQYCKEKGIRNPYSAEAVSELLNITYEYYKRLESFDVNKTISLKLILKLSLIFGVDIDEFFK
ncbi:MAG TPA: hypothetical protein DCY94_00020 [Firmicutes bacterium]|nr:hypothetical protein [Bacillota bacterium]